jgi:hypothetical protein
LSPQPSSKASSMDHPLDLTDEAPATIDQPDAITSIQAITARLRDRPGTVGKASDNGRQDAMADFPSPAPVSLISLREHEKSSHRRSSTKIVYTQRLHNDAGLGASTPCGSLLRIGYIDSRRHQPQR